MCKEEEASAVAEALAEEFRRPTPGYLLIIRTGRKRKRGSGQATDLLKGLPFEGRHEPPPTSICFCRSDAFRTRPRRASVSCDAPHVGSYAAGLSRVASAPLL